MDTILFHSFYWCENPTPCSEESYGFLDDGNGLKIICDQCNFARCRNKKCIEGAWNKEHDNRSCEEFETWMRENSEEYKENGEQLFL